MINSLIERIMSGSLVLQIAIGGQKHESFGIVIKPASGVDIRDVDEICQRTSPVLIGEGGEHVIWLIE